MAEPEDLLVCPRKHEIAKMHPDTVATKCSKCGGKIWARQKNLNYGIPAVCRPCAKILMETVPGPHMVVSANEIPEWR